MKVLRELQKISKRTPEDGRTTSSGRMVYTFGPFILDQRERVLLYGEESVSLTPKVFDTLVVLVESAGRLVTKERLLEEVWPATFVEEANLSVNIAVLRKALGKGGGKQQYIETISKRGYRFAANVVKVERKSSESVEQAATQTSSPNSTGGDPRGANFLAVLPFENVSADPNFEYLSDGLTESIINGLSQLKNLRVAARNTVFRYKATKGKDPQEIGRELGARSVVIGRILPLGDRLIISTELVDVSNGWQMWGEQYHRGQADILAIQEEISQAICSKLKARLTDEEKERLGKYYTQDPEAYLLYLKGRYHWNKYAQQSLRKAIIYFLQAIEVDPTYALAYAGLADSYYRLSNVYEPTTEAMPKAKAAALKALEIDETLAEAHAALGLVHISYEWNWPAAEVEFTKAVALKPNYALAHQRLGLFFQLQGRFDRALQEMQAAVEVDPLSPQLCQSIASTFFLMRNYDRALKEVQKAFEMNSNYHPALYLLGRIYVQQGKLNEAIEIFQRVFTIDDAPMFHAALGSAQALAGKHNIARRVLKDLELRSKERYVSGTHKAVIHLALGDANRTFECLEEALQNRCEMMTWLKVDPAYDTIRRDLRFTRLLRRVGLDRECQFQKSAAS
jgi:TolB-like protein/Tfp pilus assembly protein PilF